MYNTSLLLFSSKTLAAEKEKTNAWRFHRISLVKEFNRRSLLPPLVLLDLLLLSVLSMLKSFRRYCCCRGRRGAAKRGVLVCRSDRFWHKFHKFHKFIQSLRNNSEHESITINKLNWISFTY